MKRIAFVTDGGVEMGMGHVQQSLTLAHELRSWAEICFLTKSDERVVGRIRTSNFDVMRRNADNEILDIISEINPQLVIVDKIDVSEDFAKKIRTELAAKLAIFTNITAANKYADIAVTADYGSQFRNMRFFDKETGTLNYYGPKYWILRKEFYESKKNIAEDPQRINKILLIFGGSDPLNITSAVLDELLGLSRSFLVDVVLGEGFNFTNELTGILKRHGEKKINVNILRNVQNVAELMLRADLVMASPGLSLFEALAVGIPVIAMHQNGIQAEAYRGFIPTLDKKDIFRLSTMIEKAEFINPRDDFIVNLEIGQGKQELIETLLNILMIEGNEKREMG